jgi:tetratricopeptide (TPR) repeat protein
MGTLAILYAKQKNFDAALPLLRRALEIRRQALGATHPDVADSLSALSSILFATRQFAEAESVATEALVIAEDRLGPDHPLVAKILDNLAGAYFQQLLFTKAEPLYRRAIAIQEKALGPDHPDLAASLSEYGALLKKTHRKKEGAEMQSQARSIWSRNPGERATGLTIDVHGLDPQPKSFVSR